MPSEKAKRYWLCRGDSNFVRCKTKLQKFILNNRILVFFRLLI